MLTQPSQVPRINEYVYTPPALPAHLSSVYGLKPIVGQPTDEQVKAIHAVIGAVDAGSRVPNLYGPDLSLQLSQHLFSVQMAVYRRKYPVNVFPGDNTYSPPSLPAYVPVELESVVGAPSKEQLRAAQHAMRAVESLGNGESLQIASTADTNHHSRPVITAQYIQDSTFGEFVPKYGESQRVPVVTQESFNPPETPKTDEHEPVPTEQPVNLESRATTAIIEQGQDMKDMKELMSESKGVLENIAAWGNNHILHVDPVNQQGIPATKCGLPQLRYSYMQDGSYSHHLNHIWLAGYLKFFNIGADLLEDGESPQLKGGDSQSWEAWLRISKHLGFDY